MKLFINGDNMLRILKFFGLSTENTEEYKLLKLQNKVLEAALADAQDRLSNLASDNQLLKEKLFTNSEKEDLALQKLINELDILVLESMEPVGDA
jgi:vacuolar-type H+-ATPase subunit E/Vma4